MRLIRVITAIFQFIATIGLTLYAIGHTPFIYAIGIFSMGTAGLLAIIQLILNGENK